MQKANAEDIPSVKTLKTISKKQNILLTNEHLDLKLFKIFQGMHLADHWRMNFQRCPFYS
jgi:hypothetical protein